MTLKNDQEKQQNKLPVSKYMPKFTGRLTRKQYLISMIILWLAAFVIMLLQKVSNLTVILAVPLSVVFAVLLFSVFIRRLHDLNQSGWVSIGFFIPFVNIILAIYIFFWSGKEESNQFGIRLPKETKVMVYLFGE